jgi:hypothetical protein
MSEEKLESFANDDQILEDNQIVCILSCEIKKATNTELFN